MRFSFIILHYLAEDVTVSCVEHVLSGDTCDEISVVLVDNASPDGSGKRLADRYAADSRVHCLLLERNEGFARGNNAGYRYAVDNLSPDFAVVMNNDVIIEDIARFVKGVEDEYASSAFAVLGPDIFSPASGIHQSPTRLHPMSLSEVRALRFKMAAKSRFYLYNYLSWNIKLCLGLAKEPVPHGNDSGNPHMDCVLHGACYVFSTDFIKARAYAFNPATFLYTEEDILHYECVRAGLQMRYSPKICVLHLEDASTNSAFKSSYSRGKMKYDRLVESLDVLIRLMENG